MKKLIIAILLLLCLNVMALDFGKQFNEKNIEITSQKYINVKNQNGKVDIITNSRDDILLKITKHATKRNANFEDVEIEIDKSQKAINIYTKYKNSLNQHISVDLELEIPSKIQVQKIASSNGKVELKGCSGNAEISTSNGSIRVEDCTGNLHLTTSNGSIFVYNLKGGVSASTSNGDITAKNANNLQKLITTNGKIEAEIMNLPDDLVISTSNASIQVYLKPNLNADIVAYTSNGSVRLQGISVNTTDIGKNNLKGTLGAGGKKLQLNSSNGEIIINSLNHFSQ